MVSRLREGVAPAYLFLCLILGGSAQGIWANMILQLLGIALLAWAALAPAEEPLLPPARQLLILALLAVALVATSARTASARPCGRISLDASRLPTASESWVFPRRLSPCH